MKIDKKKLKEFSWFENIMHERVSDDDPNIEYYKSRFPLMLTTKTYSCKNDENNDKTFNEMFEVNSNFASGEECIVAMVNSGDYTLSEAIVLYATSCERCNNVLQYKYLNGKEGYPEFSEEWKKTNTVCEYCEGLKEPENNIPIVNGDIVCSKFPLNSFKCNSSFIADKGNGEIIHIISIWPYEMSFSYRILSDTILFQSVKLKDLIAGTGYYLNWDGGGKGDFYNNEIKTIAGKYLICKNWNEYLSIKEVQEYIETKRKEDSNISGSVFTLFTPSYNIDENNINNYEKRIEFPLYSLYTDSLQNKIKSIIYINDYDIFHQISIWPNEIHLQYMLTSGRIILKRAMYLSLPGGQGYTLKWKEDGKFYYTLPGYTKYQTIKEIHLSGWKDYFNIKEVKEFLKENYNMDAGEFYIE